MRNEKLKHFPAFPFHNVKSFGSKSRASSILAPGTGKSIGFGYGFEPIHRGAFVPGAFQHAFLDASMQVPAGRSGGYGLDQILIRLAGK